MGTPTGRLLELLELLQGRPLTTGREVADRLGIDARTVRRYVGVLQELGIPIEGQRGVGGGYRIRPGYRLPPLMLGNDEAVAVVLGLLAARGSEAADGALEKINRVLPSPLRRQVEALEETVGFTSVRPAAAGDAAAVLLLADAIRRRRRLRTAYRTFAGEESERELSPHGLVVHSGRWYLAAHDHLRDDLRTFRVDRMSRTALAEETAVPPPEGFDAADYVLSRFRPTERPTIEEAVRAAAEAVIDWVHHGVEACMNRYNAPPPKPKKDRPDRVHKTDPESE